MKSIKSIYIAYTISINNPKSIILFLADSPVLISYQNVFLSASIVKNLCTFCMNDQYCIFDC